MNIFHCCFFFLEKRLDVSSEASARLRVNMKNQALFSSKDKSKKIKCCLLQFLFGALRVKYIKTIDNQVQKSNYKITFNIYP